MATRPDRTQAAKPQPAQARSAKSRAAQTQAAKTEAIKARAAQGEPPAGSSPPAGPARAAGPLPPALRLAAALQAVEAAGLLVAGGFAAVATADGKSYEKSSGFALALIAVATAVLFAAFAVGLARKRPWTRTPVVMFQLAIGGWGVILLTGHRPEWGVPMLVLPAAILACVFTPSALRALNRPPRQP